MDYDGLCDSQAWKPVSYTHLTGRGKYAGAENGFEAASDGADGEPYAGGG